MANEALYDDGRISCDPTAIRISWYYLWGARSIPYSSIRAVERLPLTGADSLRRWRIWGSSDFVHWWNLDPGRPNKEVALVLDLGRRVLPTITPDDPDSVERILRERISA